MEAPFTACNPEHLGGGERGNRLDWLQRRISWSKGANIFTVGDAVA